MCEKLQIPFHTVQSIDLVSFQVNFVREYWNDVFSHFVEGLKSGATPNPDVMCNREIKFKALLERAVELEGDYLATGSSLGGLSGEGHYARVGEQVDESGRVEKCLLAGVDQSKDQSYFLCQVTSGALERVLFPVGDLHKVAFGGVRDGADASEGDSRGSGVVHCQEEGQRWDLLHWEEEIQRVHW